MTFDELLSLAKRGALVEWNQSKKVEYIFKGHRGAQNICARNVLTKIIHPIHPKKFYFCRELPKNEVIRYGQLL